MAEVSWPAKNNVEIWSRSDLSSNSLPSARLDDDDALEHAAAFEIRGAVFLDESENAGVERGDRGVEARDQRLRMRDERAHDVARRLRPVFLDGGGDVAEFVGDLRERFA